jgi:hypothetical protein
MEQTTTIAFLLDRQEQNCVDCRLLAFASLAFASTCLEKQIDSFDSEEWILSHALQLQIYVIFLGPFGANRMRPALDPTFRETSTSLATLIVSSSMQVI